MPLLSNQYMERNIFSEEHGLFREQFARFLEKEIVSNYEEWERAGQVSREAWKKAGAAGFLCPWLPEEFGGSGADFLYSVIEAEELSMKMVNGFATWVHSDIIVPYIWNFGTEEQKSKWLPGCVSGDIITAVAMTEPDAGSDLQAIRATAEKEGGHYIVNGQKTFITNGLSSDLVIVAVKTDPKAKPAYKGMSLIVVEDGTPGYVKGRRLEKIGWHAQDTAEIYFEHCRVPAENLLGKEGQGFAILMEELQQERLMCAITSTAMMRKAIELAKEYVNERKAFGRPLARFQNTRFVMAELITRAEMIQEFMDRLVESHMAGKDVVMETSMAKYFASESLNDTVDRCLQFFGGYGYMEEYPIARLYRDARVHSLYAGTSEIMKEIIGKRLFPG